MENYPINSSEYWDVVYEYENKTKHSRADINRYRILGRYIPERAKILDFGCGPGDFLIWLRKTKPKVRAHGIDLSNKAIEYAKKYCPNYKLTVGTDIPTNEKYEMVFIQHVLEHVENPKKYVIQAYNSLEDYGVLVIVLPAYDRPWKEHLTIWTLESIREFINSFGLWNWSLIHRSDTGNYFDDGTPSEETIIICKKR